MKRINKLLILLVSVCFGVTALGGCSLKRTAFFSHEAYSSDRAFSSTGAFAEATVPSQNIPGFALANALCIADADYIPEGAVQWYCAGLFDETNRSVLYANRVHERLAPASVTKILTALVAIKYGNLDDMVTVSDNARITEYGAKLCGFQPGDQVKLRDLLYGLLIYSGNDAGVIIAEHISGSVSAFADLMNAEAHALGATNTHFVNPHGLSDPDHYTTAYDLYLIFRECMKQELFMEIIQTKSYTCEYLKAPEMTATAMTWNSTNRYFTGEADTPEGVTVIGGKTGYTAAAGGCLILLSQDASGNQYISVVLKAQDKNMIYVEMSEVLDEIAK